MNGRYSSRMAWATAARSGRAGRRHQDDDGQEGPAERDLTVMPVPEAVGDQRPERDGQEQPGNGRPKASPSDAPSMESAAWAWPGTRVSSPSQRSAPCPQRL